MTTNGSRQGCLKSQQWPINISYFCACPWQVAFTMIGTCVQFLWTDKWSVALGCIIFNPISAHQEKRSHILQNNSSEIMKLVEKYRNGDCYSEVQFGRSFQTFKFLFYTISRYLGLFVVYYGTYMHAVHMNRLSPVMSLQRRAELCLVCNH